MTDQRVERLAELVVDYSLELGEGQVVRIDGLDVGQPLALAVYRAALRAGAHPYTNVGLSGLVELLLQHGSKEQREFISPIQRQEVDTVDAIVTIWSEANTRSLSGIDPAKHAGYMTAHRQLLNRRWERISRGEMSW
jgi:aminopeptidase